MDLPQEFKRQPFEKLKVYLEESQGLAIALKGINSVDIDSIQQINNCILALQDKIGAAFEDTSPTSESDYILIQTLIQSFEEVLRLSELLYSKEVKQCINFEDINKNDVKSLSLLRVKISTCSSFKYLHRLGVLEDSNIEFKNYSYTSLRSKQSKGIIRKTIVSLLNREGGQIYIGIRDDSTVIGLKLTMHQMDILKRRVISIKQEISPPMNDKVNVDFIPISFGNSWIKSMWVIRINVKQGDVSTLYSIPSKTKPYELESYFREDGAVLRYSVENFITERIEIERNPSSRRLKQPNVQIAAPNPNGVAGCMDFKEDEERNEQMSDDSFEQDDDPNPKKGEKKQQMPVNQRPEMNYFVEKESQQVQPIIWQKNEVQEDKFKEGENNYFFQNIQAIEKRLQQIPISDELLKIKQQEFEKQFDGKSEQKIVNKKEWETETIGQDEEKEDRIEFIAQKQSDIKPQQFKPPVLAVQGKPKKKGFGSMFYQAVYGQDSN